MRRHATDNRHRQSRGVALIMVLWVMVFLSVIAGEFCRTMRTEVNIARNYKERIQAYYTAVGGLNLAVLQTLENIVRRNPLRTKPDAEADDGRIDWRVNAEMPEIPLDGGKVKIRIDNEGGKVNINLAGQELLLLMLDGFDLTDLEKRIIVDAIQDWRDADNLHRLNGAENDYYQSLPEPYPCKNRDFDSVEELLRVRGVTPALYHGGLSGMVTVYPSRRSLDEKAEQAKFQGLEPAADEYDYNKISINAAPPELLSALRSFTPDDAAAIAEARKREDIPSAGRLGELVSRKAYLNGLNFFTYTYSPYYMITATGSTGNDGVRQSVSAVVRFDLTTAEKYFIVQWFDHANMLTEN